MGRALGIDSADRLRQLEHLYAVALVRNRLLEVALRALLNRMELIVLGLRSSADVERAREMLRDG